MKRYKDIVGDAGSNIIGQVVEQIERLKAGTRAIQRKLVVMSGKGGVGKSAVTANLASAFAMRGCAVGILDADLNGPAIAKMLGVRWDRLETEEIQEAWGKIGMEKAGDGANTV